MSKYILRIHIWTTWFSNRVDFLKESNKSSVLLSEEGMILSSLCKKALKAVLALLQQSWQLDIMLNAFNLLTFFSL